MQQKLEHDLLFFACRHHVLQRLLGAVFNVVFGNSKAPDILPFKRFRNQWNDIDTTQFRTLRDFVGDIGDFEWYDDTIHFCKQQLSAS